MAEIALNRRSVVGPSIEEDGESPKPLFQSRSMEAMFTTPSANGTTSFPVAMEAFRREAKMSSDPFVQLDFVRYLMESTEKIALDPEGMGIKFPDTPANVDPAKFREERKNGMVRVLDTEALRWIKRLALSGAGIGRQPLADAQFMLAECYGKGTLGLPVDHARAFHLYVQASKQNHPTATFRAAVCYEVGAGAKRDYGRAVIFYRKAAALGDIMAMQKVAIILLYGKLKQKKNLKEGITWLKRAANAADQEHPESLHDLAQCYERKGGCPVLIADEHYAFELYAKAARFGYAPSQYRLGSCYEFGLLGCQVDPASSIKWYSKSAEQGFAEAELALSSWYLSGSQNVLHASDADAFFWARKAAERGLAKAQYQTASFLEIGIGVTADVQEAMRWYGLASAQGHKRATHRLVELKKANSKKSGRCSIT